MAYEYTDQYRIEKKDEGVFAVFNVKAAPHADPSKPAVEHLFSEEALLLRIRNLEADKKTAAFERKVLTDLKRQM